MKRNDLSCVLLSAIALLLFSCKKNGAVNNGKWTTYNYPGIGAIAIDARGNKWFGADFGLLKLDDTTWTTYNTSNSGLAGNDINAIAIDSKSNMWIGTQGEGVSKFDGTDWTTYNTSNSGIAGNDFYNGIAFDAQGNTWFACTGSGVSKFDGVNWTTYNTANSGLANNVVNAIVIDSLGNKWFGTDGGVSKFDGAHWITYTTSNSGLFNHATGVFGNGSGVLAIAIDAQGNMWFGGTEISEWQPQ